MKDRGNRSMKKSFVRMIVFVLFLSMCFLPATVAAEARASYYIYRTQANVVAVGNGDLRIDFNITGTGTMTSIGATTIEVKKLQWHNGKNFL